MINIRETLNRSLLYKPLYNMETIIITLSVREYYVFNQIAKSYIYIGYTRGQVVIAANEYLLQALGY